MSQTSDHRKHSHIISHFVRTNNTTKIRACDGQAQLHNTAETSRRSTASPMASNDSRRTEPPHTPNYKHTTSTTKSQPFGFTNAVPPFAHATIMFAGTASALKSSMNCQYKWAGKSDWPRCSWGMAYVPDFKFQAVNRMVWSTHDFLTHV